MHDAGGLDIEMLCRNSYACRIRWTPMNGELKLNDKGITCTIIEIQKITTILIQSKILLLIRDRGMPKA